VSRYELGRSAALRPSSPSRRAVGTAALACIIIAVAVAIAAICTDPTADLPAQPYETTIP